MKNAKKIENDDRGARKEAEAGKDHAVESETDEVEVEIAKKSSRRSRSGSRSKKSKRSKRSRSRNRSRSKDKKEKSKSKEKENSPEKLPEENGSNGMQTEAADAQPKPEPMAE